ncbi:tetratricopeptide repeat protein [Mycobacterium tuberculosis]|uniref:tetratricopeptide repeat protein n=1 Tax=Mycobacterium tuberculosis TaxID=1773 RepID=UPI00272C7E3B|nr:tetratricopeptide repeat protein [Mycobacterium tuberculosis]
MLEAAALLQRHGRHDEALDHYRRAHLLDPADGYARELITQGHQERALHLLTGQRLGRESSKGHAARGVLGVRPYLAVRASRSRRGLPGRLWGHRHRGAARPSAWTRAIPDSWKPLPCCSGTGATTKRWTTTGAPICSIPRTATPASPSDSAASR